MKPDLTRSTFAPRKHFSRVVMQQGRVQLDADWNEQVDILEHTARMTRVDLMGLNGAPATLPGVDATTPQNFQIVTSGTGNTSLAVSPGRYYVDGILCACDQSYDLTAQPDLPGYELPAPPSAGTASYTIYLEVWTRVVTGIEDPSIIDPALGGADTATRAQTVWQIRAMAEADWTKAQAQAAANTAWMAASTTDADSPTRSTLLDARVGYTGLENYLYLIEIQQSGAPGTATFAWSRYNGSVALPIVELDGNTLTLASLGRDQATALKVGDWIQVRDNTSVLWNEPGPLSKITDIEPSLRQITVDPAPGQIINGKLVGSDPSAAPYVQLWEQTQNLTAAGTILIPAEADTPVPIENGIEVTFYPPPDKEITDLATQFRAGDFWMIPARANFGLLWPGYLAGKPEPMPADGQERRIAALALASLSSDGSWSIAADKRQTFAPVGQTTAAAVSYVYGPANGIKIANATNVEDALNALAAAQAPATMALTIGNGAGAQFASLSDAWNWLLANAAKNNGFTSVTFFLMAGATAIDASGLAMSAADWQSSAQTSNTVYALSIAGYGQTATLTANGQLQIDGFASLAISGVRLILQNLDSVSPAPLTISGCNRVAIAGCYVFGNSGTTSPTVNPALIGISGAFDVELADNEIVACNRNLYQNQLYNVIPGIIPSSVQIGPTPLQTMLRNLYNFSNISDPQTDFDPVAAADAIAIAAALQGNIGGLIQVMAQNIESLQSSYSKLIVDGFSAFAAALSQQTIAASTIAIALQGIYEVAIQSQPQTAVLVNDRGMSLSVHGNKILGLIVLGGPLAADVFTAGGAWQSGLQSIVPADLCAWMQELDNIHATQGTARIVDNELAGLTLGGDVFTQIVAAGTKTPPPASKPQNPDWSPNLTAGLVDLYRDVTLTDNRLTGFGTLCVARSLKLFGNEFYTPNCIGAYNSAVAAYSFAYSLIVSGNDSNVTYTAAGASFQTLEYGAADNQTVVASNSGAFAATATTSQVPAAGLPS